MLCGNGFIVNNNVFKTEWTYDCLINIFITNEFVLEKPKLNFCPKIINFLKMHYFWRYQEISLAHTVSRVGRVHDKKGLL